MTKVALVGHGYWGAKLLRNLVNIVGPSSVVTVDCRPDHLASLPRMYPDMGLATSLDAVLCDNDVRAVIIATPMASHASLAMRALDAGRHVLVEKPLASSIEEAVAVANLADLRGLVAMVGHSFLFSPRVNVVADYVRSGQLGPVDYALSSRINLGIYRRDANVIWDLAPHDFSILFHVLDERPVTVQTTAQGLVEPNVPDVAFVNLTFPSGAIASVTVSWRAPRKVRTTIFVGKKGMLVYDDTQPDEPVKIYDRGVERVDSDSFGENQLTYRVGDTVAPHVSAQEPLSLELEHFMNCVEDGSACASNAWFGVDVVRALAAADLSWRRGGLPVDVPRPVVPVSSDV
jgi:predicted dehydrogenase